MAQHFQESFRSSLLSIVEIIFLSDGRFMLYDSGLYIDIKGMMGVLSESSAVGEEKIQGAV